MKIAIVGAREFPSRDQVVKFVKGLPPDWEIVSGGAPGVDTFAQEAAAEQHRTYTVFYADWKRVGKAAGMLRNTEIANTADACVAFIHGPSKGTMDTVRKCVAQHKPVWVLELDEDPPSSDQILAKVTSLRSPEVL